MTDADSGQAEHRPWRRRVLVVALGALLLLGAVATVRLLDVRRQLVGARADLAAARSAVVARQDDKARAAVARAERRLAAAGRSASGVVLRALRVVPLLGSPAQAAADATHAARETAGATRTVVDTAERLQAVGGEALERREFSDFHRAAVDSSAALARARRRLDRAAETIDGVRGAMLPMVSGPGRAVGRDIDRARRQLRTGERALGLLADLTDPRTDARLLLLAQDTFELRATGGYQGSYGVLHFAGGRIRLERYEAAETLPFPDPPAEPPEALAPALPGPWAMSNANWWPDFPTSARTSAELFARQGGTPVDGVLALTEDAAGRLVGLVDPLPVPGYTEPVVEKDFGRRVLYEVGLKEPRDVPRKKFLIALAPTLFDRLLSLPVDRLPAVRAALDRSTAAGEVQVWFAREPWQRAVAGTVLSGELPRADGDFLMLVDTNMSGSKANLGLVKHVAYRVRRADGRWRATLDVVVRNEAPEHPLLNPYYNGYLRVYVPRGARLLGERPDQGDAGPAPDGPFRVFAQLLDVQPEQQQRVRFEYDLPAEVVEDDRYRLTWLRQVGTPRDVLVAEVDGRRARVEGRRLSFERSYRGHPVTEWLQDRWIVRRLGLGD